VTLSDLQRSLGNDTFLTLVHIGLARSSGLVPADAATALGALYVNLGLAALLGFNVAHDTPLVDLLEATLTGSAVPPADGTSPSAVAVTYAFDGTDVTATLPIK
jgi:hypothetical protein